ncbi:MAG TPA: hypothetical protein ENN21_09900 [Spirochaetes bacterium]|nr:hypothetical protein [Spirochaetota bacterium]
MDLKKLVLKSPLKIDERAAFPRPDCLRSPSYLLNGTWFLCPDEKGTGAGKGWHTREFAAAVTAESSLALPASVNVMVVRVPFALESDLNRDVLEKAGYPPERIRNTRSFWYYTRFKRPADVQSGVIHFGAVDYRAEVWCNGARLGSHEGGYTPFSFTIERFEEENLLAVRVEDSLSMGQLRGKQTFLKKPFMVWYTGCTGIWQPVWIEPVKTARLEEARCVRDGNGNVRFMCSVRGLEASPVRKLDLSLKIYPSQVYGKDRGSIKTPLKEVRAYATLDAMKQAVVEFSVPEKVFSPWSPDWPAMHPLRISLTEGKKEIDLLHLTYGHRSVEVEKGEIRLNKKRFYQKLLLHQGYYPGGHYTPAGPEEFRRDIELMKGDGFNGCRMHQKIEHPAFLYWADLLGFVLWEEMPSYYLPGAKNMARLENQLREVMNRDSLHPSVITLVLYNESWGVYDMLVSSRARRALAALYERSREAYPGYLVVDNSGFHHVKTDIADIHHYIAGFDEVAEFYDLLSAGVREAPLWMNFFRLLLGKENAQTPFLKGHGETQSPLLISEFGGYGFDLYKHEDMTLEEFLKKHLELIMRHRDFQGFCYTQFCDTFQEKNGLYTLERKPKSGAVAEIMRKTTGK